MSTLSKTAALMVGDHNRSPIDAEAQRCLDASLIKLETAYHSPNGSGYAMIHVTRRPVRSEVRQTNPNTEYQGADAD